MAKEDCVCWDYETPDIEYTCDASDEPTTHLYRLKAYTGPAGVKCWAENMRLAGFIVAVEGTEHVHIDYRGWTLPDAIRGAQIEFERVYGVAPGIRFKAV